ncbi:NAD-dependent epimerase/dehydratase family protein [soil metagenome]
MKALVTGAAGFIGSNVVRTLLQDGHDVRALHLPGENVRNLRGLDVERMAGDVTDRDQMRAAVRGCEVVFHLAAVYALWTKDADCMQRVNVEGTRNVLDAARAEGVRRVVHTSSIARFGGQGPRAEATEQSAFALGATGDRYSRSKADAHELAVAAARAQDVVIVAPCGPIGPGDAGPTPTGRLLLSAVKMPIALVADTSTNFADVRDMARGHVLAAERGKRGETYLLGCRNLSLVEIARMALDALGDHKRILVAPFAAANAVARGLRFVADRITRRPPLFTPEAVRIAQLGLRADCTKAVRELGLPQSPIETAVADAMAWFGREGYL